jgi:hypothetical protein
MRHFPRGGGGEIPCQLSPAGRGLLHKMLDLVATVVSCQGPTCAQALVLFPNLVGSSLVSLYQKKDSLQ